MELITGITMKPSAIAKVLAELAEHNAATKVDSTFNHRKVALEYWTKHHELKSLGR